MPMYYYKRAITKTALGEHIAAIKDFNIAVRLKPNHALTYYKRGQVKLKLRGHLERKARFPNRIETCGTGWRQASQNPN